MANEKFYLKTFLSAQVKHVYVSLFFFEKQRMTMSMLKEIVAFPCAFAADIMAVCSSMASYLSTVATNMAPHLWMVVNLFAFFLFPGEHDTAMIACYTGADELACRPLEYYIDPDYDWGYYDRPQMTKTALRYFYYAIVLDRIVLFTGLVVLARIVYRVYKEPPFDEENEIEPRFDKEKQP